MTSADITVTDQINRSQADTINAYTTEPSNSNFCFR